MAKEDYTTYTVVEENDIFDDGTWVSPQNSIAVTGMSRNETSYVYKDHGVGHFGDITLGIDFEMLVNSDTGVNVNMGGFALANALDDIKGLRDAAEKNIVASTNRSAGSRSITFASDDGSVFDAFLFGAWGTRYYCKFTRSGTTSVLKIYDDEIGGNLVDTLSISPTSADTFRYLYPAVTFNTGHTNTLTGEIANHDLLDDIVVPTGNQGSYFVELNGSQIW